ncbi:uncharacterized protein EV154DRAFT_554758 [Mucor mucedo]|uniref:uncharacterized protein n=1 Tax=Mucor mucedo TaxID=29922 RepID=UPI00221F228F|nr:uncharacterized protein EV154DRAFT_554758 [Mucor mucedo]KAI7885432.1 hypothetical protein EV154DRAFT_554758 [Mucor mucedo]
MTCDTDKLKNSETSVVKDKRTIMRTMDKNVSYYQIELLDNDMSCFFSLFFLVAIISTCNQLIWLHNHLNIGIRLPSMPGIRVIVFRESLYIAYIRSSDNTLKN